MKNNRLTLGYSDTFLKACIRIIIGEDDQCWEWIGATSGFGHPQVKDTINKKTVYVHHLLWDRLRGPRDKYLVISHMCNNPGCVNPRHWTQDTQSGNQLNNAQNPKCKYGHERFAYYSYRNGTRECLECARLRGVNSRHKDKELSKEQVDYLVSSSII